MSRTGDAIDCQVHERALFLEPEHVHASLADAEQRRVVLEDGSTLDYDRLVLSPDIGLDYGPVPGWSEDAAEVMPHERFFVWIVHVARQHLLGGERVRSPQREMARCKCRFHC